MSGHLNSRGLATLFYKFLTLASGRAFNSFKILLVVCANDTFTSLRSLFSLSLCNVTSRLSDFTGVNSKSVSYFNFSNNFIDEKYANVFCVCTGLNYA